VPRDRINGPGKSFKTTDMKTHLEKFIKKESKKELKEHHLFLTQLYLMSKEHEEDGRLLSVWACLLMYISEIIQRHDPELIEYMKDVNEVIEKLQPCQTITTK
jgi:hypothetical protein